MKEAHRKKNHQRKTKRKLRDGLRYAWKTLRESHKGALRSWTMNLLAPTCRKEYIKEIKKKEELTEGKNSSKKLTKKSDCVIQKKGKLQEITYKVCTMTFIFIRGTGSRIRRRFKIQRHKITGLR